MSDTDETLARSEGAPPLLEAFDIALGEFDRLVHEVPADGWQGRSGCSEWALRDVVNHLVSEHLWAPHLLRKETTEEVGDRYEGDVVGDDPRGAWEAAAAGSRSAFHAHGALEGAVHVSYGDAPASEYGWHMTTGLAVHAWDLAHGVPGASWHVPDGLARELYDRVLPMIRTPLASTVFARPLPAADDPGADPRTRLLALLGRDG